MKGYRQYSAGKEGISAGRAARHGGTKTARTHDAGRYAATDCPFCFGPLLMAPQCSGRAVSDAGPGEMYYLDPLPNANIAVICRPCELAFFPLAQHEA